MPSAPMVKDLVVFGIWPELGAYNATLRLAKQVLKQGIRVVYLGPARFQKYVEAQGFTYAVMPEGTPEKTPAKGVPKWTVAVRNYVQFMEVTYTWLERWIEDHQPALLLLDQSAWIFSPPFLKSGVPVLALGLNYAAVRSSRYPPVFTGIVPAPRSRVFSRVRNALAWWACDAVFWRRQSYFYLATKVASLLRDDCDLYTKSLVKAYGGRVRRSEYGYQLAVPELVLVPPEFDFPRGEQWHHDHFYGGLGVDPERVDVAGDLEGSTFPWERLKAGRKLVFCSLGTYSAQYGERGRFYQVVLEAFRRRRDLELVLALGKSAPPGAVQEVPENVILVERAPVIELLKMASVLITHGGCSSVREALLFGVPMIVFPCWYDQPGNGARVVYHGVGVVGDIGKIEPEGLCQLLEEVLSNPAIAERARRMSAACRKHVDCQAGVEFIVKYVNRQTDARSVRT